MKRKRWKYETPKTIKDLIEQHGLITHIESPNMSNDEFWDSFTRCYSHVKVKYGPSIWYKLTKPIRMLISRRKLKKMGIIKEKTECDTSSNK